MTTLAGVTEESVRLQLARVDFVSFLPYVKIQNTERYGSAVLDFEVWPHLVDTADLFERQRFVIVVKPRQVGLSWQIAAYVLWTGLFHQGANVLLLSKGDVEAKDLLGKVKFIFEHLPYELKAHVVLVDRQGVERVRGTDNTTELGFEPMKSRIRALPATETAGIGNTSTLVVMDEADEHANLEQNFNAIRPTLDAPGSTSKHIMVSALYPNKVDSFFRQEIRAASHVDANNESLHDGRSSYVMKFLSVWVRPGRDDDWYKATKAGYPDEHAFTMQYPRTLEEAMSPPESQMAFRKEVLDEWQANAKPSLDLPGYPPDAGVWRPYSVGNKYAAFTDTSHGVGGDYAITVVLDCATGLVVADIYSKLLDPDDLAMQSVRLLERYDSPIWGIEDNDWGIVTIRKAQELGYRHLYHRPLSAQHEHSKGRVGWHTDETRRRSLFGDLQQAVKDRAVTVMRKEGIEQFYQTVRNQEKGGRVEAIMGGHDDYPLAVGGALQMVPYARRSRTPSLASAHLATEPLARPTATAGRTASYRTRW